MAAVGFGARAVRVPRGRFVPVKTTGDLLVLWSDVYELTDDYRVVLSPQRQGPSPLVDLDAKFYRRVADLERRFPAGPPSLVQAKRLQVRGDVRFGRDVVVAGDVAIAHAGPEPVVIVVPHVAKTRARAVVGACGGAQGLERRHRASA